MIGAGMSADWITRLGRALRHVERVRGELDAWRIADYSPEDFRLVVSLNTVSGEIRNAIADLSRRM